MVRSKAKEVINNIAVVEGQELNFRTNMGANAIADMGRGRITITGFYEHADNAQPGLGSVCNYYDDGGTLREWVNTTPNPDHMTLARDITVTINGSKQWERKNIDFICPSEHAMFPSDQMDRYFDQFLIRPMEDSSCNYSIRQGQVEPFMPVATTPDQWDRWTSPAKERGRLLTTIVRQENGDFLFANAKKKVWTFSFPLAMLDPEMEGFLVPSLTDIDIQFTFAMRSNVFHVPDVVGTTPAAMAGKTVRFVLTDAYLDLNYYVPDLEGLSLWKQDFNDMVLYTDVKNPVPWTPPSLHFQRELRTYCNMIVLEFGNTSQNIIPTRYLGGSALPFENTLIDISVGSTHYPEAYRYSVRYEDAPVIEATAGADLTRFLRSSTADPYLFYDQYCYFKSYMMSSASAASTQPVLFDKRSFLGSQFRIYIDMNQLSGVLSMDSQTISLTVDISGDLTTAIPKANILPGNNSYTYTLISYHSSLYEWNAQQSKFTNTISPA